MRILFLTSRDISNPSWAGGDVYVHMITKRLVQQGQHVTLLCDRYFGSKDEDMIDGVHIIRIKGGPLRALRNFQYYVRNFKGLFDVVVEEAEGPAGPFFASLYIKEPLIVLWHQQGKGIFLNEFPLPISLGLMFAERVFALCVRGRLIIVPTFERVQELASLGIKKRCFRVVKGATELQKPIEDVNSNPAIERPFFLALNKIRKYKCFHHTIYAFAKILQKHPECRLVIAGRRGSNGYEAQLRRIVEKHGLTGKVCFWTNVPENDKLWLLANSCALLVPSPVEGFSIVAVEANSLGTPVIASTGVPKEVISDGVNGLVYPFGDIDALANVMINILEDSKLRCELSRNARQSAARFSWEHSALAFARILGEARMLQTQFLHKEE